MPNEDPWYDIRETLSAPPGRATESDERRETYVAALQQSHLLFKAAVDAQPPVKPLPLFYGMSQASRAIAACGPADEYVIDRHGLTAGSSVRVPELAGVCLTPQSHENSAFRMMQRALDGHVWTSPVTMGALWEAHPELHHISTPSLEPPALPCSWISLRQEPHADVYGVSVSVPAYVADAHATDEVRTAFMLRSYPGLARTIAPGNLAPEGPEWSEPYEGGARGFKRLLLDSPSDPRQPKPPAEHYAAQLGVIRDATLGQPFHSNGHLIPLLGGASALPSHFILWWAVLFGVSMRARYEPRGWLAETAWAKPTTVPLERAMDQATTRCPRLILEAIRQVST